MLKAFLVFRLPLADIQTIVHGSGLFILPWEITAIPQYQDILNLQEAGPESLTISVPDGYEVIEEQVHIQRPLTVGAWGDSMCHTMLS